MAGSIPKTGASSTDLSLNVARPHHFLDLDREQLADLLLGQGAPSYRCKQVLEWAYQQRAESFEAMSNLPKAMRSALAASMSLYESTVIAERTASDGTVKLLLRWPDGTTSETVLIPDGERRTACISTQVGCPVACVFCASGLDGLQRNLTTGQIVEQAMRIARICGEERLSNVVFMGLGEPLANYDATVRALRTINAEWGLNVGARKITISTVGLPSRMKQLADEKLQVTLALSLHAPTDALRKQLIPWAKSVTINELVDAARYYFEKTGREVTLEYVLLRGINDSEACADQLAAVTRRMRSNVNLIPYNPVSELPYERPSDAELKAFLDRMREHGVNTHLRRSRGLDVDAACGQLRRRLESGGSSTG